MRGIFFDEDTARSVARQLEADGYHADVSREPFAGEDDDEDHPWAVTTDAPAFQFELHVEQYDGWLEPDSVAEPPAPLELPSEPRRLKRRQ